MEPRPRALALACLGSYLTVWCPSGYLAGMPTARDPRKAWRGGELDVFTRIREMQPTGASDSKGRELFEQTLVTKFSQTGEAVPLGDGFALLLPSRSEDVQHLPSVELQID